MHATVLKKLPRWAWVLAGFLVLVLLVDLIAPYFLDADRYRPTIISAIEDATGRTVKIGKIRATKLLPHVSFVIENFALSNPPEMAEGNLLTVEAIRGGLSWGPLFKGEIQLDSVELDHPTLVLLEDDRGKTNYDFSPKKKPGASSGSAGFRLAGIDSVTLSDADVTLARVTGRKRALVTSVHATKLSADVSNVALDAGRLKEWTADADLSGVQSEFAGIRGPLKFDSGDLKLRNGAIDSKFEVSVGKLARVKGTVHVADIEKGVAELDLSTPLLDLDQFQAVTTSAPSVPTVAGKSELVARGRFSADRIRYAPYEGSGAKADLRVFTDRMEIWPVTMALYGGSIGVSARVDKRQTPQRFSANIEVRNVDVGKMLNSAPSTKGKMTGTGELTLQAIGSLGNAVTNSLTGAGNFAVRNGKLPTISLGGTMQALGKMQQVMTLGQSGLPSGETTFSAITGDLALGGGRISSSCIHVNSSAGTVDMRGSFGFDQTLRYEGKANLTVGSTAETSNPLGAITGVFGNVVKQTVGRIPSFAILGTFSDPKIRPGPPLGPICGNASQSTVQQQPAQQQ
ncbi:MAG TPA: AsmA family protein, partial [Candidatus Acidoferrales bacterium]|nr:AsmA family protein [Candidatus Acidoferrales bacterium]